MSQNAVICQHCGAKQEGASNFCVSCGKEIMKNLTQKLESSTPAQHKSVPPSDVKYQKYFFISTIGLSALSVILLLATPLAEWYWFDSYLWYTYGIYWDEGFITISSPEYAPAPQIAIILMCLGFLGVGFTAVQALRGTIETMPKMVKKGFIVSLVTLGITVISGIILAIVATVAVVDGSWGFRTSFYSSLICSIACVVLLKLSTRKTT